MKNHIKDIEYDFNILPQVVRINLSVNPDPLCNSITFINQGNAIITINSTFRLYPGVIGTQSGESFSFGGNLGEIFKGRVDIAFDAAGNQPICIVLQKIYINTQR